MTVGVVHANPEVIEAAVRQIRTFGHVSTFYLNDVMVRVAEKLAAITPGRLKVAFFSNSGTEADEMAIMAAIAPRTLCKSCSAWLLTYPW